MIFFLLISTSVVFAEIVEAIVAKVNNEVITLSDVKKVEVDLIKSLTMTDKSGDLQQKLEAAKKRIVEKLVEQMLLLQEAKKKNLNADEELNESIAKLKQENNIETDEQLKEALKNEGMTFDDLRNQLKERIMQQKLLFFYLQGRITITDQEIAQYYKEHTKEYTDPIKLRLSLISVSFSGRTKEEALEIAKTVLEKAKAGEEFSKLAQESSDDPSKDKGGDLGFLTKDEMNPKITQTAFSLKAGEVSDIIETDGAYQIIKIVEKVDEKIKDLESTKSDIYADMFNKRAEKYQNEYLDKLKKENYVIIFYDPYNETPAEKKQKTPDEKH